MAVVRVRSENTWVHSLGMDATFRVSYGWLLAGQAPDIPVLDEMDRQSRICDCSHAGSEGLGS